MTTSNDIVIESPMSYRGSAKRLMQNKSAVAQVLIFAPLTWCMWIIVTLWYLTFGVLIVPFRLIRRSQRKADKAAAQHAEVAEALRNQAPTTPPAA